MSSIPLVNPAAINPTTATKHQANNIHNIYPPYQTTVSLFPSSKASRAIRNISLSAPLLSHCSASPVTVQANRGETTLSCGRQAITNCQHLQKSLPFSTQITFPTQSVRELPLLRSRNLFSNSERLPPNLSSFLLSTFTPPFWSFTRYFIASHHASTHLHAKLHQYCTTYLLLPKKGKHQAKVRQTHSSPPPPLPPSSILFSTKTLSLFSLQKKSSNHCYHQPPTHHSS